VPSSGSLVHSFPSVISHSFLDCTHIVHRPADTLKGYGPSHSVIRSITRRNPLHALPPHASLTRSHSRSSTTVIELCIRTLDRGLQDDIVASSAPVDTFSGHLRSSATSTPHPPETQSPPGQHSWSAISISASSSGFAY
jgi:hypothetical protein